MYACCQKFVTPTICNIRKGRTLKIESTFVEFTKFLLLVSILHERLHKHSVSFAFSLQTRGPFDNADAVFTGFFLYLFDPAFSE
jgi:hypothetical protein